MIQAVNTPIDKNELWRVWKAHGVTQDQGKELFALYERTGDTESVFNRVFDILYDYRDRYAVIYALRRFHKK